MSQRLIVIHGRSTKPAKNAYKKLQLKALLQGISRVDPAKADKISSGEVKTSFIYYGDINNKILAEKPQERRKLTAIDPSFNGAPCLPSFGLSDAINDLGKIQKFSRAEYRKILEENSDLRFLDDAARALSTLAAISSATFLNMQVIARATADMGAYLLTRKVGSDVRQRLQGPLKRALLNDEDICIVSHSMGCIVTYDVLWKLSRMSEHVAVPRHGNRVNLWLALGSPLGEAGVKRNLYDGDERGEDLHPKDIIRDWVNVAAHDDFVSHDASMRDDYKAMKKRNYVDSITDKKIYNCYTIDGTSNPHKLYGYLAHDYVGEKIAEWIR